MLQIKKKVNLFGTIKNMKQMKKGGVRREEKRKYAINNCIKGRGKWGGN